nr:ribonuclease H [Tanacetum cinerariifolium]
MLFPVWSSGSKNPQNTDGDSVFDDKEPDFKGKRHESKVYKLEFEDFSDDNINEVNAADSPVLAVGKILTNNTNTFSAADPSNAAVSPTHGKSSCLDTSQYPDDLNMLELEDITYFDDQDVGAKADFTNLETSITVSPIPAIRVHKDHHVTQIIEEPKRVHQALKDLSWIEAMQEELLQFKMQKTTVSVKTVNDMPRLQALVEKKKVIITEATIRDALRLDDAEGIDCLPNREIFTELARMGTQVGDLSSHTTKYSSLALTQKPVDESFADLNVNDVTAAGVANEGVASVTDDNVPAVVDEPFIPIPTPPTQTSPPSQDIPSTSQRVKKLEKRNKLKVSKLRRLKKVGTTQRVETSDDTVMDDVSKQGRIIADMDIDVDVTLKDIAKDVSLDAKIEEGADVQGRQADAARRRKGVVIRDPKETATPSTIIHTEPKSKDKGKGIMVHEPKPLTKKTQIEQNEAYARELEAKLNKNIVTPLFLTDYGFHFDKIPMYCDSMAAIAISCNPVQHSRTKHIDVRYHFIKEKVEKGIVELFFVGTEYRLADLFTKALPVERFQYLVRRLGMRCLTPAELEALSNESA